MCVVSYAISLIKPLWASHHTKNKTRIPTLPLMFSYPLSPTHTTILIFSQVLEQIVLFPLRGALNLLSLIPGYSSLILHMTIPFISFESHFKYPPKKSLPPHSYSLSQPLTGFLHILIRFCNYFTCVLVFICLCL